MSQSKTKSYFSSSTTLQQTGKFCRTLSDFILILLHLETMKTAPVKRLRPVPEKVFHLISSRRQQLQPPAQSLPPKRLSSLKVSAIRPRKALTERPYKPSQVPKKSDTRNSKNVTIGRKMADEKAAKQFLRT